MCLFLCQVWERKKPSIYLFFIIYRWINHSGVKLLNGHYEGGGGVGGYFEDTFFFKLLIYTEKIQLKKHKFNYNKIV